MPDGLALDTFAEEFAGFIGAWEHVRATRPDLPHLDEAAELAAGFAAATAGDTLVHTDLRDDNLHPRRRRPGVDVRLELAGARRRLARHAAPC